MRDLPLDPDPRHVPEPGYVRCVDCGFLVPRQPGRLWPGWQRPLPEMAQEPEPPQDFGEQVVMRGGLPRDVENRIRAIEGLPPLAERPRSGAVLVYALLGVLVVAGVVLAVVWAAGR